MASFDVWARDGHPRLDFASTRDFTAWRRDLRSPVLQFRAGVVAVDLVLGGAAGQLQDRSDPAALTLGGLADWLATLRGPEALTLAGLAAVDLATVGPSSLALDGVGGVTLTPAPGASPLILPAIADSSLDDTVLWERHRAALATRRRVAVVLRTREPRGRRLAARRGCAVVLQSRRAADPELRTFARRGVAFPLRGATT